MLDPFDQKKALILKEISSNSSTSPDASPKGTIDELCIPMMNLLNSHPDIVTTSSCSGRVSVFLEGTKVLSDTPKIGAKGDGGHWIFVSHDETEIDNWWKDKKISFGDERTISETTRYLVYKFEPFILHVKCRDLSMATKIYTAAMGCGFRESGIGSNNVVAVRISIKLDIPIGYWDEEYQKLIAVVNESYLKLVVKLSLDRFKENTRKINMLYNSFERVLSPSTTVTEAMVLESKEERRLRKMKEGMDRRDEVRKSKQLAKLAKLVAAVEASSLEEQK